MLRIKFEKHACEVTDTTGFGFKLVGIKYGCVVSFSASSALGLLREFHGANLHGVALLLVKMCC